MNRILHSFYFRWLLVGLLLRFLIMPFTFHWDLQAIQEIASRFFEGGPMAFYTSAAAGYPVSIFLLFAFMQMIFRPWLDPDFLVWLRAPVLTALSMPQTFLYLFVMKFVYLFFDLATACLLTSFFKEEKQKRLAFICWIFNPFTLHTTFAWGHFDIIPVFLTVLALVLFLRKKIFWSVVALGIGGAFKLFPLLFLPFFLVTGERLWLKRITLFLVGIFPWVVCTIPFLSIPLFRQININSPQVQMLQHVAIPLGGDLYIHLFLPLIFLLWLFALKKHVERPDLIFHYCLVVLLLFYAFSAFHFQWFLWGTPFFIWHLINFPKTLPIYLVLFLTYLAKLILEPGGFFGLLAPIAPELYELPQVVERVYGVLQIARLKAYLHSVLAGSAIFLIFLILKEAYEKRVSR